MPKNEPVLNARQKQDAAYTRLAQELAADSATPRFFAQLAQDARVSVRRSGLPASDGKCIVYWMQRAQRGSDNHALDLAIAIGNELGLPVIAYFAAISNFPHANLRHYYFLQQGLPDIEQDLAERGVGFVMRRAPHCDHEEFFADVHAAMVIGDENPMREPERWRQHLAGVLRVPFWTVDTDVIVPSKLLEKAQFSAGVARPRLYRRLAEFLIPYENTKAKHPWHRPRNLRHDSLMEDITRGWRDFDRTCKPVDAWHGGHHAAVKRLHHFTTKLLPTYDRDRNRPELDGTTALSPYLHFGHIGPLTIALAVDEAAKKHAALKHQRDGLFNELIAWRELAVNFVRYQPDYDNVRCADNWAAATIAEHDRDEREITYSLRKLEAAETYDELWNAAQIQMNQHGWMHNYMRMYWCKKIVEWTPNATTAMRYAIHLNDRYFLDGRDPNGYAGVAWAVLGKFDRAWGSRPVFGKRRYMSGASTGKKFDSKRYIEQMREL